MRYYEAVYGELELPITALRVARGELVLRPGATIPFVSEGFPPALIPLWSDDVGYYGYWKHWFCRRKLSIVRLRLGEHMIASEVARSFEQFVVLSVLEMMCGGVFTEQRARRILLDFGLDESDYSAMVAIAECTGDNPTGLQSHPRFTHDVPLECCLNQADYRGDFPIPDSLAAYTRPEFCGFELPLDTLQAITPSLLLPWLPPIQGYLEQPRVFDHCLERKDLAGAWMSLNSPAWTTDLARSAIHRLAMHASDPRFSVLSKAWISERQSVLA